jgi:hypothetical protein
MLGTDRGANDPTLQWLLITRFLVHPPASRPIQLVQVRSEIVKSRRSLKFSLC